MSGGYAMYNFIEMDKLIRKHRRERKLTIEQLAELSNLSYRCISNIERGLANPKFSTVVKIFTVLGKDLNELKQFVILHNSMAYYKTLGWFDSHTP